MSLALPGVGILFDIDGLGGGYYGYRAWQIFMGHIRSDELSACVLVEGDALMYLAGSENLFCIGIYGIADFRHIRDRFEQLEVPGLVPMPGRIIEKPVLDLLPLPIRGHVDAFGRFVTESWNHVDHTLCKEARWGYDPQQIPTGLDEQRQKELHYMRVELPMEQTLRGPEPRPHSSGTGPLVTEPAKKMSDESGRWAGLRRLFSKRSS